MTPTNPRILAVLVNWRRPELTIAAAQSVAAQSCKCEVVVVDNGSGDGSAAIIAEALPHLLLIERPHNGGFGAGCNAGIAHALAADYDYIWLLNNDAEPRTDALAELVAVMSDTTVAIAGSCLTEPGGTTPDHAGAILNGLTLGCSATLLETDLNAARWSWISGASALLRVSALRLIGAFDEGFFMYWEDADLSARIRAAGYRLAVATNSIVAHEAGTSSAAQKLNRYRWHLASHRRYIDKHMPYPGVRRFALIGRYALGALKDHDFARLKMVLGALGGFRSKSGATPRR